MLVQCLACLLLLQTPGTAPIPGRLSALNPDADASKSSLAASLPRNPARNAHLACTVSLMYVLAAHAMAAVETSHGMHAWFRPAWPELAVVEQRWAAGKRMHVELAS